MIDGRRHISVSGIRSSEAEPSVFALWFRKGRPRPTRLAYNDFRRSNRVVVGIGLCFIGRVHEAWFQGEERFPALIVGIEVMNYSPSGADALSDSITQTRWG